MTDTTPIIADNLVRGAQVARNLIYKTISEGVEWNSVMYVRGTYTNSSIAYKKEDIKTAPVDATSALIEVLKKYSESHLVIYPSKKEYIVTLIFNGQEYSIKQPLPTYDNHAVLFPSVEYIYTSQENLDLGH